MTLNNILYQIIRKRLTCMLKIFVEIYVKENNRTLNIFLLKMILRHGGRLSWTGEGVHLRIDELDGDGTGSLNVRSEEKLSINRTTSYFKTALLAHVNSSLNLPQDFNCHSVNVVVRGAVNAIKKVTVGPQCALSLERYNEKLNLTMGKLVIQTDGTIKLMAKPEVEVQGVSLDIRGGARVSMCIIFLKAQRTPIYVEFIVVLLVHVSCFRNKKCARLPIIK